MSDKNTAKKKIASTGAKRPSYAKSSKVIAGDKKSLSVFQRNVIVAVAAIVVIAAGFFVVQTYQDSQTNAASCVSKTYKKGSSGTCVKYIQILMNYKAGKSTPKAAKVTADGSYGAKTETAMKAFQKYWGLTADGIVGKKTWASLCSAQMGYTDSKGVDHGVWTSNTALDAAKSAGCSVSHDVVK